VSIPFTLRRRLLVYTLFLTVLLIGFLLFFYQIGREAMLQTAGRNTELTARQVEGKLRSRELELERHVRIISENNQLREYMFIVVSIGTDKKPLDKLFEHLYGWEPFSRVLLLSREGEVLVGKGDAGLLYELGRRGAVEKPKKSSFYWLHNNSLDMISVSPLYYQKQYLGNIVLAYDIGEDLINSAMEARYGQIFIVSDKKVIRSTLANAEGKAFTTDNGLYSLDNIRYRLHPVNPGYEREGTVEIWFGLSDVDLLDALNRSQQLMFGLALVAGMLMMLGAYITFNRFSAPIGRLVTLMGKVGDGQLPNVQEVATNDEIGYLTNRFNEMVGRLRRQQLEIDKVHQQLEEQATTDELTGFYNRRFFYDIYPKLWSEANRQRKTLGIIIADLDHFKRINDAHGHLVGDEVLQQFTNIVRQCSRVSDFLVRMGGEEFLILTSEGIESAQILAEKIRSKLANTPIHTESGIIKVTCSFGIAQTEISDGQGSLSAVLRRADLALYQAKKSGRNRVATWDENLMRA